MHVGMCAHAGILNVEILKVRPLGFSLINQFVFLLRDIFLKAHFQGDHELSHHLNPYLQVRDKGRNIVLQQLCPQQVKIHIGAANKMKRLDNYWPPQKKQS